MNERQPIDLLIVGTGALATLFAARLSAAGHSIRMLGTWKSALEALQKDGARIIDERGQEKRYPVAATSNLDDCRGAKYAIVLVKTWQTERAARQLAGCLAQDGLAVTLQNGLGNFEQLSQALNIPGHGSRVVLGVTTTGATQLGPGLIRTGGDGLISIEGHPGLSPLADALRSAGFKVQVVKDARALVWGKLVINAAINPLTAILRVPNGELLDRPPAKELMFELAGEAAAVSQAEGVSLPFKDPQASVEEVARKTASNHSSMLQDVLRGAPTEIDAICGAVVERGLITGVATPVNLLCWKLVKALVYHKTTLPLEEIKINI